ncbi:hypothetical protein BH23VER1_BH23VER1_03020 [soil metagenome]
MTKTFPILLWRSHAGPCTGRLLDADARGTAIGSNPQSVLQQLDEYVRYLAKNDWLWEVEPDLVDVSVREVTVQVFPEYRVRSRTFPAREPTVLRLPAVVGRRESGSFAAVLPTVDVVFEFGGEDAFDGLAQHYVRSALAGLAPRDVARFLPPAEAWLESLEIPIKPPSDDELNEENENAGPLAAVADPLGDRTLRRVGKTWERESEVKDLVGRLTERSSSICLVGAPGCGKTSVVVAAARRVERAMRDKGRRNARTPRLFWLTSAGRLVAGMRYLGQWEERLEQVIDETAAIEGTLCIENLLELVRLGGSGPETSIGAFLIPYLEHGELRIVTEATSEEVEACERLLPGLIDQLQILKLDPFDDTRARRVLHRAASALATSRSGATITREAVDTTFSLFKRFQPYAGFPGRAIAFLRELADPVTLLQLATNEVTAADARTQFSKATGLPRALLDDSIPFDTDTTTAAIGKKVLGQPEAVSEVCSAIARLKTGLNDPARPLGVFLFTGPTGVGKTALVRALADLVFAEKPASERLIRLDMSEYASYDAARRLLGDPFGEPSELVRRIRANPFSVILLDEIEKAADEVFDIFLNVFDEARLTDTFGRLTTFTSALIIMTSNLGSDLAGALGFQSAGGGAGDASGASVDAAKKFFRPEFFNRLDRVVPFRPLAPDTIRRITALELAELAKREGIRERRLTLQFSDALVDHLAATGFDPKLGARPLQRKIEDSVTTPLARYLIADRNLHDRILHLDEPVPGCDSAQIKL